MRFWLTVLAQYALPRFVPGDDTRRRVLPSPSLYVVPSANFLLGDIFLRLAGISCTALNLLPFPLPFVFLLLLHLETYGVTVIQYQTYRQALLKYLQIAY